MKKTALTTAILAASTVAQAQLVDVNGGKWEGGTELGFTMIDGNTDTNSFIAGTDLINTREFWKHSLGADAYYASEQGTRTAEQYNIQADTNREITDHVFIKGLAGWNKDNFSAFDYQTSLGLGLGAYLIKEDNHSLEFSVAPGWRHSEFNAGGSDDEYITILGDKYSYGINDKTRLFQTADVSVGEDNTITNAAVGITTELAHDLALKAGYTIEHQTDVPAGTRNLDRKTTLTILYSY
ncbi:MAG: DUF481 domain-containing protein [Pseudomonadota bacterium]|nr:DUF481 domain-containing protein [Pseudomonadota bacterium]